jgi:hypothetical protein
MNGNDGVQAIVLAGQERGKLQAVELGGERVELGADLARDLFALAP